MHALNAKELERRDRGRTLLPVARRKVSRVWDIVAAWFWYQRQRFLGPDSDLYVPPDSLPPMELRRRVNGLRDIYTFLATGRQCADDVERSVVSVGRPLSSFQNVLDFGCGCGRTTTWLLERAPGTAFTGTDVDAEAVRWCQGHLTGARFDVNTPEPPLPFADDTFDLVYVVSLFSHFDEAAQERWIDELLRVTAPGGLVVATVHGEYVWADYPADLVDRVRANGFAYLVHDPSGPAGFQTSYQSEAYVRERFGLRFKVLDYVPQGLNHHQDVVVLEKR